MKNYHHHYKGLFRHLILGVMCILAFSCQKLIDNNPSSTQLLDKEVFKDSLTVKDAVLGMYGTLGSSSVYNVNLSAFPGFSADELKFFGAGYEQFINNAIQSNNADLNEFWSNPYSIIYQANAIIEGLNAGANLTEQFKTRTTAEARFIRAFCYFYLINTFGDVPLVLTTDVEQNRTSPRMAATTVYNQVIEDLRFAQANLPLDYTLSGGDRIRANKWVATGLLARVYLYTGNWTEAEAQSTTLINNTSLFGLVEDLTKVFAPGSKEAIFQFYNPINGTTDYAMAMIPSPVQPLPKYVLTDPLIQAFEPGDDRKSSWTAEITYSGTTYTYPAKYKELATDANTEYFTVFRLAEQYLIRAEARSQRNNVLGAREDIFAVRDRAGLGLTSANDKDALLLAIEQERRIELNCEMGHRWFDLKRTKRAAAVIGGLKPGWKPYAELYPVPNGQRMLNRNLSQNLGYN